MTQPQNFKNHARLVPAYHIGVFFPLLANFFWAIYRFAQNIGAETTIALAVSVALLLMFFSIRTQILTVQDRVIRLEMRMRLRDVLPSDLQPHIPSLTVRQLVALRFASDAELADLVHEVLAGRLGSQREIKMRVHEWQADWLRA
jgi:hypothetical protein